MLTLIFIIIFALFGWMRAHQLGGNPKDRMMYAASFGLAGFVVGLFASLILDILF